MIMLTKTQMNLLSFPLPDLEMILVEGGTYRRGDENSEYEVERPVQEVCITSFHLSKFLITQALYEVVMGENPSYRKGKQRPVEKISWDDTKSFLEKLNQLDIVRETLEKQGLIDYHFRLPSESEWEYAAGNGKYSQGCIYAGSDELKQVGWYDENSNSETKPVGLLQPNELGLYDISGNIHEWCEDDWHDSYKDSPIDGSPWIDAPSRAYDRVIRGGTYFRSAIHCRPASRIRVSPGTRSYNIGFR